MAEPMTDKNHPFQILGIADNGNAYFQDDAHYLQHWPLQVLDKKKLITLTDLSHWEREHPKKGKDQVDWDHAVNGIIMKSKEAEFDPERIKGRGAWRTPDGKVCYFDGNVKNIFPNGNPYPYWIFTKRVQKDIGLEKPQTSVEIRREIYDLNKTLAYENKYQAAKLLAWCALAPFCGALYWRPAILLTSSSGVGKSTIADEIVKPLTAARRFSGGGTTEAGIRQSVKSDACPVVVEELEDDTKAKAERRDGIMSLMRQSTSDDAPDIAHGTSDGGGISHKIKCMFMMIGISPEISREADSNRIVKISLTQKKASTLEEWHKTEATLKGLMSDKNTAGIRAFTFANLDKIFDVAKRLQPLIQKATKENARFVVVESQLIAAVLVVWLEVDVSTNDKLDGWVAQFYEDYKKVDKVDDTENLIFKLLDTEFTINEETVRGTYTMRAILRHIKHGNMPKPNGLGDEDDISLGDMDMKTLKRIARQKGFGICNSKEEHLKGNVMISKNSQWAKKILDGGSHYELLKRHPDCKGETTASFGGTASVVVIGGLV